MRVLDACVAAKQQDGAAGEVWALGRTGGGAANQSHETAARCKRQQGHLRKAETKGRDEEATQARKRRAKQGRRRKSGRRARD